MLLYVVYIVKGFRHTLLPQAINGIAILSWFMFENTCDLTDR